MRKEVKYYAFDGTDFDNAEECMEYESRIISDLSLIKNNVELYDGNFQRIFFPIDFFEKISKDFHNIIPDFVDYIKITNMQEKVISLFNYYSERIGSLVKIIGGPSKYGFYRYSSDYYVPDDTYIDFIKSIS